MSFPVESSDGSSSLSSDLPLPNEISTTCFALLQRRYHPVISLVSKPFSRLIASPELYAARSLLHTSENVIYVALRLRLEQNPCWYSLNLKPFKDQSLLVPIPSFPSLPYWGSSVIAIGYEIYVFGGCIDGELTSNVSVLDCRFHTCHVLPSMRVARGCAATGVIDGKVYVIGGCKARSVDWIEMFDLEKKTWESVPGPCNEEVNEKTIKSFVMDEKIYVMDNSNSFVYDPKENKWEVETVLNEGWRVGSCVLDNILYTFGDKNQIKLYDPNTKVWRVLKGVEDLHEIRSWSRLATYGGKLAVLINVGTKGVTEISCTEIELETREGGEVWGKILSSDRVLSIDVSSKIVKCVTVTV
ncbi:hypothetical protein EUTSA_v10027175mg [Eutrema salsugineum]|uniref:F-box domain-containing protein n=1 Tax=Eutrema salsugineum TaxID=72664 RepID=V4MDB5_EUTSA|nr:F-box/kelch-repeat protein At4g39240 [Eutrema salsugineum]ESQ53182.1 hypothetical protein EUTSA_v10027175mg [Eutrema salsugineum]